MKSGLPAVSVVLPVYNAQKHLGAALDSLWAQDFDDFEVVAVDDGSTDASSEILARHTHLDDRLRIIRQENAGPAAAANASHAAARGRCIARMDADDVCSPDRIGLQLRFLEDNPAVDLAAGRVRFGGCRETCAGYAHYVDWINTLLTHEDMALHRFVEQPLANPSIMFRREALQRFGGYAGGPFPEDYEFFLRLFQGGARLAKLPQTVLTWNDPPGRLTRTDPRYDIEAFYRVKADYLIRLLASINPFHPDITLIGSGRRTRQRAAMLEDLGARITSLVDIDPRKIGNIVDGKRVIARSQMPGPDECFVVSYVGSRGAREEIAEFLEERGFRLGETCILAA